MSGELKQHLKQKSTWMRGLYMLLFALFYSIAEIVIFAIVVFQFFLTLFTGKRNERLLKLGQSLSTYVYQIMLYLTFNAEYQAYPFGAWPKGPPTVKSGKKETENVPADEPT